MRRLSLAALALALLPAHTLRAQPPRSASPAGAPAGEVTVTLITFGQGRDVAERFGHDALWFHDARTGVDSAYHWGLFDYAEPHFVARFVTGDTRYWMGSVNPFALIEYERRTGRPVTLQRLNLTPQQATKLYDFVRWNALEDNKYYRYDYFRDNCATRLRDALDLAVGGAIRRANDTVLTTLSYRSESLRLTDGDRPVQAGIDLALGLPADRPLTKWQSFFIPMRLRDALRDLRVPGADGVPVPLVAEERALAVPPEVEPVVELTAAPLVWPRYLLAGLLLAVFVVLLRVMATTLRGAVWGLAITAAGWNLLCGLLGVAIALAWAATKHVFWAWNENLFLLTPLSLALVVLAPMALLSGRAVRAARVVALAVAAFGLVALLLGLLPLQDNSAIVALFLPVHLALAWAIVIPRRLAGRRAPVA